MHVFLNSQFLPEGQAFVSVFDRGFLYGDGLFETLRVVHGHPFRWDQHWQRLVQGAEFIRIHLPLSSTVMRHNACQLVEQNRMPDSLLRIMLSRGVGARGYSPKGADRPTLVMSLHPAPRLDPRQPATWRLVTSSLRLLAQDRLAPFKTSNKLVQILARAEADAAGADEALLLDSAGHLIEGTSSNLFWLNETGLYTAPLSAGILPGVTRALVFEIAGSLGLPVAERMATRGQLQDAQGIFLSMSSVGIAEAVSLDGSPLQHSPWVERIWLRYHELLVSESVPALTS